MGRGTWHRLGAVPFHGATPTADQAAATDLASVITLANEMRTALLEKGLIKGGT